MALSDWDRLEGWEQIHSPQGDVEVPAGKNVWLYMWTLDSKVPIDHPWLSDLQPDDVYKLDMYAVGDKSLERIREWTHLRILFLNSDHITDIGLNHLEELDSLFELTITGAGITKLGMQRLRRALPRTQIINHLPRPSPTPTPRRHPIGTEL